jgi:hypothetical protein
MRIVQRSGSTAGKGVIFGGKGRGGEKFDSGMRGDGERAVFVD